MARLQFFTTFSPYSNPAHRTLPSFGGWTGARAYARQHGTASVLMADGRVRRYGWNGTALTQRTYAADHVAHERMPDADGVTEYVVVA
jgi:hypothetical protein